MQAQGSNVNTTFFDNLTEQVNQIDVCSDLQNFINDNMPSVNIELSAINLQIAKLEKMLTIPSDLGGVINWIKAQIAPYQAAYDAYSAQLTATTAAIGRLTAALGAAASRIEQCSITFPSPVTITS